MSAILVFKFGQLFPHPILLGYPWNKNKEDKWRSEWPPLQKQSGQVGNEQTGGQRFAGWQQWVCAPDHYVPISSDWLAALSNLHCTCETLYNFQPRKFLWMLTLFIEKIIHLFLSNLHNSQFKRFKQLAYFESGNYGKASRSNKAHYVSLTVHLNEKGYFGSFSTHN